MADDDVLLAAALAVRAPRLGHVLRRPGGDRATTVAVDADEPRRPGRAALAGAAGVARRAWRRSRSSPTARRPAEERRCGSAAPALYLDRYWREERQVAADLRALAERPTRGGRAVLADGLARLFADAAAAARRSPRPRRCCAACRRRGRAGHGQDDHGRAHRRAAGRAGSAAGAAAPLVALAAPTGKAAARLQEAVHEEAGGLESTMRPRPAAELEASTLHRLLGWRPAATAASVTIARTACPTTS